MDLKKIGLVILTFIVLACAVQAATNSYSFVKTTTAELSNSAWYQTCTVSSNQINFAYSSTDFIGRYVSGSIYAPNATYGSISTSGVVNTQDAYDIGWLNADHNFWMNSTDYRHVTGGHSFYQIRYTFDKAINSQIEDVWFTGSGDCTNASLTGSGATFTTVNSNYPEGYYMNCDGVDDYSLTTYAYDYTNGNWNHALMVYPGDVSGSPLGISDADSYAVIEVQYVNNGASDYWQVLIRDQNNNVRSYYDVSKVVTPNTWHCLFLKANSDTVYLYDNGVLQCSGLIKYDSSSSLTLNYIELGGIYYGGSYIADFTGRIDEYRFLQGYLTNGDTNPSTSNTIAKHMWNCDNQAYNTISSSYKLSSATYRSGNLYTVISGRCRNSGSGFTVPDTTITILNTAPTYSAVYPNNIDYPSSDVTLRVVVHDPDVGYISNISGLYYLDGVSKGTATITTDGNLDKNVGSLTGGAHTWYASVYDPWGGSVLTSTSTFNVTDKLYIKNEETDELITGAEVTVSFYTANTSVVRTSSNGSISLYGLPTSDMLVSATADGYTPRKTIVFSLYDTNSVYLLNESSDIIYQKFVLNTQTITGSPTDYILKIQKPMNGTVNTVFSSYFDFDGVCGTYLIESDVYQLVIVAPDGTESTYGYLYPDPDGQIDIAYEGISFNEYVNAWLVTNTSINKDTKSISLAYDEAEQTSSLNPISVTEATMIVTDEAGTQVYNVTVTDSSYVFQYIAASEGRYTVNLAITGEDEDGQEFSYTKSFTADFIDDHFQFMPDEYPDWLKMLVITFLCILLLVSFGGYRSDLACGLSFGLYAFSAYQEWISVSALALGVLFIIVMAAFFKLQRKIKRSG